jgi:hypothetical protein
MTAAGGRLGSGTRLRVVGGRAWQAGGVIVGIGVEIVRPACPGRGATCPWPGFSLTANTERG